MHRLLVRPNESHQVADLVTHLWPDAAADVVEILPARLRVVASRLRRCLEEVFGGDGSVGLKTVEGCYVLTIGPGALDRVEFEHLAQRALGGEPHLASAALDLWRGRPYADFGDSAEVQTQRIHLTELHDQLVALRDRHRPQWSLQESFRMTKFRRPRLPHGSVVRPRLLDHPRSSDLRLITLSAPAGFGKTVLLTQWAEAHPGPVAWVTLGAEDADPASFWASIFHAFNETAGVGVDEVPYAGPPGSPRFAVAMNTALEATAAPIGIVLDDAHHAIRAELFDTLADIGRPLPDNLTVAVATREPIPPPVDRVVDPLRHHRIEAPDLRFDAEEMVGVTRRWAHHVNSAALLERTNGWPVAVAYIGSLAGDDRGQHLGRSRVIDDYLVDEVLAALPDRIRAFLLHTGPLRQLHPDLCDAVTGRDDAEEMLAWLLDHGVFVTQPAADEPWSAYHEMVRDPLTRIARTADDVDVPLIHTRAAHWYRTHRLLEAALGHAIDSGDGHVVVTMLRDALSDAVDIGDVERFRRILRRVEPRWVSHDPDLLDLVTVVAAVVLEPREVDRWLMLRPAVDEGDVVATLVEAIGHRNGGDATAAIVALREVLAQLERYVSEGDRSELLRRKIGSVARLSLWSAMGIADIGDAPAVVAARVRSEHRIGSSWLLGEQAFLAYIDGDQRQAAALVAESEGLLARLPPESRRFSAGRTLIVSALLDADNDGGEKTWKQSSAVVRSLVRLYEDMGWRPDLVISRSVLFVLARRAGADNEALRQRAAAEILLGMCPDAPFLRRACDVLFSAADGPVEDTAAELTAREREVLHHLTQHRTYAEIASGLGTSINTVRSQVSSVYRKLGVRNRHEALRRVSGR